MVKSISTIIFDWGRTLHDPVTNTLFDGVIELIPELSKKYTLALVSLAKIDTPEVRRKMIDESGIAEYFQIVLVGGENKDEMYERVLSEFNISPEKVAVIDDRTVKGIAWGNRKGALTVWFKNGKFADELPDEQTGHPSFTVATIPELKKIFI